MNRTERRAQMRADKRSNRMAPAEAAPAPLKIDHGHTEHHVVMQFSQATAMIHLTPEQAQALIASVQRSMEMLAAYQAKKQEGANGGERP